MVPMQVVANHITRAPKEVTYCTEHGAIAQSPDIHEIQEQQFPIEAFPSGWHTALGTVTASELGAAMVTDVLLSVTHHDGRRIILLTMLEAQNPCSKIAVERVLFDNFLSCCRLVFFLFHRFHDAKVYKKTRTGIVLAGLID